MYKDETTKKFFMSHDNWNYYLSVAHFEELFHARNNETDEYKGESGRLKAFMQKMSLHGILKPTLKGIAFFKNDKDISSAIDSIENEHNTQERMKRIALVKYNDLKDIDAINGIKGVKQEEIYKKIWEQDRVTEKIGKINKKRSDLQKNIHILKEHPISVLNFLNKEYVEEYYRNSIDTNQLILDCCYVAASCINIQKNSYGLIKNNYQALENIIETLYDILDEYGFKLDRTERTAISSRYDIQHSIMSTYCDVFITTDKKYQERYKSIAWYLDIPIKILRWEKGQLQ